MRINNQSQEISFKQRNILITGVNGSGINRSYLVKEFLKKRENCLVNRLSNSIVYFTRKILGKDKIDTRNPAIIELKYGQDFLKVGKNNSLGKMLLNVKEFVDGIASNGKNEELTQMYKNAVDIVVNDKKTKKIKYSSKK